MCFHDVRLLLIGEVSRLAQFTRYAVFALINIFAECFAVMKTKAMLLSAQSGWDEAREKLREAGVLSLSGFTDARFGRRSFPAHPAISFCLNVKIYKFQILFES